MQSRSQQIRSNLAHPVIDSDGHVLEYLPAALPFLRDELGPQLFEHYLKRLSPLDGMVKRAGVQTRTPQSGWWGTPARNTRDLATAVIPRLLHERLDEFGMDFTVLYPTKAFGIAGIEADDLRIGVCRGFNRYFAETYGPFADRMTMAGVIPMHTPDEAVAEIEHCHQLGLKVVGLPEGVLRAIPEPGDPSPWLLPGQAHWFDTFGLDSAFDYDPVWSKLGELRFAATCHGGLGDLMPFTFTSVSSFVSNHIGYFAERMQKLCKSLFFGGVTTRFPRLNIALLECGSAWASPLLADIVEHWERRNLAALEANLDPALIDWPEFERLMRTYGGDLVGDLSDEELRSNLSALSAIGGEPVDRDEFRALELREKRDIYDRFVPRFFFGCEADDRTVAFAFSKANAFGARLQPVLSSDIGHWDVDEMADVVTNSFALVEKGILDEEEYETFVSSNPLRLFTGSNPQFFEGTVVEGFARRALADDGRMPTPGLTRGPAVVPEREHG
jgi:predicted TIM-barrel fold metal-dependent hydrolase